MLRISRASSASRATSTSSISISLPATRYWQRSGEFWRDVRAAWERVYSERDTFEYLEEVDGQEMFVPLFEHAERLEAVSRTTPRPPPRSSAQRSRGICADGPRHAPP